MAPPPSVRKIAFDDLPDDIVTNILQFLDHKGVARFSRTSKRNRELGSDNIVWYKLFVRKFGQPGGAELKRLHEKCPLRLITSS